jgi:hypothetical protein
MDRGQKINNENNGRNVRKKGSKSCKEKRTAKISTIFFYVPVIVLEIRLDEQRSFCCTFAAIVSRDLEERADF